MLRVFMTILMLTKLCHTYKIQVEGKVEVSPNLGSVIKGIVNPGNNRPDTRENKTPGRPLRIDWLSVHNSEDNEKYHKVSSGASLFDEMARSNAEIAHLYGSHKENGRAKRPFGGSNNINV